jgi:hypothetical protein
MKAEPLKQEAGSLVRCAPQEATHLRLNFPARRGFGASGIGRSTPFSPPFGPASVSCNGPHLKSKFLAIPAT